MKQDKKNIAKALAMFRTKIADLHKQQVIILKAFSERLSKKKNEKIRSGMKK